MKKGKTASWFASGLVSKKIDEDQVGVFTKNKIKNGAVVCVLGGKIYTVDFEKKLPQKLRDNGMQITDDLVIGFTSKKELDISAFFNHSCEPNLGINGQIVIVAIRDIKAGEQLFLDYAMVLGGKEKYSFSCNCKTHECRGVITNNDWKISALQKKYQGYFQYYLEEKIKKINK